MRASERMWSSKVEDEGISLDQDSFDDTRHLEKEKGFLFDLDFQIGSDRG